jgi:hypothetical protein
MNRAASRNIAALSPNTANISAASAASASALCLCTRNAKNVNKRRYGFLPSRRRRKLFGFRMAENVIGNLKGKSNLAVEAVQALKSIGDGRVRDDLPAKPSECDKAIGGRWQSRKR